MTPEDLKKKRDELNAFIATSGNPEVRRMAEAELQKLDFIEGAAQGDQMAQAMLLLKDSIDVFRTTNPNSTGVNISQEEVDKAIKGALKKNKIAFEDLNAELKAKLAGQVKVQLTLSTPFTNAMQTSSTLLQEFQSPLFQKLLSDFLARNNVYLYGGAGTGKTTIAKNLANFLGYKVITVNCNQFTSPLDLVGGQTITGYQKGKLEMAWTNIDEQNETFNGAILLLDELPKLDPNTAGILNDALAEVKNIKKDSNGNVIGPIITNGRGQQIILRNMFVIATGNVKLNETSSDYEANFKQDLSLQDRFAGSCYEVLPNYRNEFEVVMKGFAFIWIFMTKLRQLIIDKRYTGNAFVSYRILITMRDTYVVYRNEEKQKVAGQELLTPKTLKQALDSFLNLFTAPQLALIMQEINYDAFVRTIEEKNKLPLDALDTPEELQEGMQMVLDYEKEIAKKIA
jgi:hypothetical protein